jgi:iron complex transport system substrate-binding protein
MPPIRILRLGIVASAIASFVISGAHAEPRPARPQRIVSLNLCSDQYLVELADPQQIAGLTRNATNREMSAVAGRVGKLRVLKGSAEEILAIGPDLVIGMPARGSVVMAALSGQSYRTVDLAFAQSYADIVAQVRTVAAAVGHPARGEALIARMNRQLATLPRPGRGRVAAYYQRRGFLTGTGTLVDDLMTRVGLTNLAGKLGKPSLSTMSLEELMVAQPDYMIVESGTDRVTDQGTEMLHHPLLRDIRRLRLPQAWTVCGGPAYVDAARSLAMQIARHEPAAIPSRSAASTAP